jgi:phosphate transport system substrate-binding protein
MPSEASAVDGSYPLSRPLFMDTAAEPSPTVRAYLDWITGPAGQEIVRDLGFVPIQGK